MRALRVLALPIGLLAAPAFAQGPAEEFTRLCRSVLDTRAELAQRAFDDELYREAGHHADRVLAEEPGHAIARVSSKIKAMSGEAVASAYRKALRRVGPRFRRDARRRLGELADQMVDLAADAREAQDPALAERILVAAYGADPDNRQAERELRKLDYDVVFNYGVIPGADKASARKMLRRLGGGFMNRARLADELEFWADAWGLQTRNYRFVTNADHGTVLSFAQACEDLFEAWHAFMKGSGMTVRRLSKPCTVYLFDSKASYELILRVRGLDPADSDSALGFYQSGVKIGFFYNDPSFYGDDLTLLFETFYHEGAHQLFDLAMKSPYKGDLGKHPLHWVEEGFCVYLETLERVDGPDKPMRPGTVIDDDLASALAADAAGQLLSLDEFVHGNANAWDEYGLGYPHAALMVHYLMSGDRRQRRAAFGLLYDEITQGGLRKKTLFELLRTDADKLGAKVGAFAADLRKSGKRRTYKNDR